MALTNQRKKSSRKLDKKTLNSKKYNSLAHQLNLSGSALRVIKLLQWLNEEPLSSEEFNERFYHHPLINKKISNDSIWLYINTLKALGCEIERPKPSNNFKYVLKKHPFGIYLSDKEISQLAQIKKWTESKLEPGEWLHFSRFFKSSLDYVWLQENQSTSSTLNTRLLKDSRSIDYDEFESITTLLQEAITDNQLVFIEYQSPVKGGKRFYFLPESCLTKNGAMYIHGYQEDRDVLVQLRIDRINSVEVVDNDAVKETLKEKSSSLINIQLFVMTDEPELFPMLDGEENRQPTARNQNNGLEINLRTRDIFTLRQQLFSAGHYFQVVTPVFIRKELQQQLQQMSTYYKDLEDFGGTQHA